MLTLMFFASLAALFGSVFLLSMSATMAVNNRVLVRGSIKGLNAYTEVSAIPDELATPFLTRVIVPFAKMFIGIGRRLTPVGFTENIKRKLVLAGIAKDVEVDRFLAYKGFCLIGSILLSMMAFSVISRSAGHLLGAVAFAGLSFFAPDLWLNQKIAARQKAIRLALPDTLDLLTISVEAGLGFDAALHKVVRNTTGPLSEEFYRLLQEVRLGTARNDAFRNFGERTQVDELNSFILAVLQAEVFGISIGQVLRVQARELRIKRRQRAEEMAQKAPVKIVFPLVCCIFPVVLIVVMGPAVIQIFESVFKAF